MIWLGLVAKGFYAKQIGTLMKPDVNWTAAIIFYLIFIAGLITPAVEKSSWAYADLPLFFNPERVLLHSGETAC